jgi:autotransporter-associated beta strand protein
MRRNSSKRLRRLAAGLLFLPAAARATDINYVQPAAMDQPRIHAYLSLTPGGEPQSFEDSFNIEAFFDTGASGVLLSNNTAAYLGVTPATHFNPVTGQTEEVAFHDVGVVGGDVFGVSTPVYFGLAPYHPDTDVDNLSTFRTVYNQTFGPIRTQIGPPADETDPMAALLGDLDVFGVPLMQGKVVVMDPRPVNSLLDTIRTYVYNPNTPFNSATEDSNPGIPTTSRHVKLSYADFARFTSTTPQGATGPTLAANPFIGPNPLLQLEPNPPQDNTPGVKVSYNGRSATGSWLLDTGAAASMISETQAQLLGITYDPATEGSDNPTLLGVPLDEQFTLTIGGIGGTKKVAGFFLDSLLLRTEEGNAADDDDPNHFRFLKAPVLVTDITVEDPDTHQLITLDGIFGVNYLVASAKITEVEGSFPSFDAVSTSPFSWAVFDQPNGRLGLELDSGATEKHSLYWAPYFLNTWLGLPWSMFTGPMFMDAKGNALHYKDGDLVNFTDDAEDGNVDLYLDVAPESILVHNSTLDYTFSTQTDARIVGPGSLIKRGAASLTMQTANTYRGLTEVAEGTLILAAPQDIGPVYVHAAGRLVMQTDQRFQALHIVDGKAAMDPGNMVLIVDDLTIDGAGQLDLANNSAVIHATHDTRDQLLADLHKLARTGRAHDANLWQGPGLASSSAAQNPFKGLAVVLNDKGDGTPIRTDFLGESVGIDDVIVFYTWTGDFNLDGTINLNDYFLIDSNYLAQTPTSKLTYAQGDINYDGIINLNDYFLIDSAYLAQSGGPQAMVLIPEPASLSLLAAAFLLLPRRRR